MDIIQKVQEFVEEECKKPTSKYGYDPYPFHFVPVVKYAQALADKLGGDKEVITIAAWLHDIGSIIEWRENHHETWAEIAEKKLREYKYPEEKIALVKKCIFNHRWSKNFDRESIEEQILAEADIIASFDNVSWIFMAAFVYENLSQSEAKESVKNKFIRKRNQLHFEASKELIKPKYEAAMLLLS